MDAISSIASPVWLVPAVMVLLQTAYWVLRSQESRVSPEEASLQEEIRRIKAELSKLSMVSNFVEVSLKERKIIKAQKALTALQEGKATATAASSAALLSRYIQPALYVLLVLAFWSHGPIATLPAKWFWPLTWVLRSPGLPAGSVGGFAWVFLCHSVISAVVRWAAQLAGVQAAQPASGPGGILGKLMSLAGSAGFGRPKVD